LNRNKRGNRLRVLPDSADYQNIPSFIEGIRGLVARDMDESKPWMPRTRVVRLAIALAILPLLCGRISSAQDPDVQDLTNLTVEDLAQVRLSTASRHLTDARKAPAPVTTIGADEIRRQGWLTLADLLASVPGFYTASDRTYTYLGVRGFLQSGDYNARVLLLIDGHRVNDNIYDSALIGTEFPLDMSQIDRVEIMRGPGSSLFGTNAELAVVNVFTKRPDTKNTVQLASEARSEVGRVFEAGLSFRFGDLDGLASGSIFRSNGATKLYFPEFDSPATNNGIAQNIDGDRYDHAFGMIRRGQFRLEALFGVRHKIVPIASYGTIFNDPANFDVDRRGYVDAKYSHQFAKDTDLDLRFYYDAYRYMGSFPYQTNNGGRTVQINDAASDGFGFESVLSKRLGRNRVVAGMSGEYNLRLEQRNYYIGQPPFLDDHRTMNTIAGFGETELNPYRWLSLNLGGRVDWYSIYGTALSPRVALMVLPTAHTSVKYIVGHAFRAPDPYDEFYVDQLDITATNTKLRPESVNSHTILVEQTVNSSLSFTASVFQNDLNRIIEEHQDASTGATHFANLEGDRGRGLEFELNAKSRTGWSARSSYVFTHAVSKETGLKTLNSPATVAKLNGVAPLGRYSSLGLEFLYTGPQNNFAGQRIGSSLLTNTTLSTPVLRNGWEFSASCYNLFDRRWATPTGPEVTQPATIQDGRGFRFRISYRRSVEKQWH
jgi:outer membrane receptor for ferrienterochelin and colicins